MALLPTYFQRFLAEIEPTKSQREDMQTGHKTLRKRLDDDEDLSKILIGHFLQGSYRRSTAVRPALGKRSDVDVIVVTNLDSEAHTPQQAIDLFLPFVEEHYAGKYKLQGRSIGIELSYVDLDLVVTAAPSEAVQQALKSWAVRSDATPEESLDWRLNGQWLPAELRTHQYASYKVAQVEEWKTEPLEIPNRDADAWEPTDPLAQIRWTFEKNRLTDGHYVKVVKVLKWWRRTQHPEPAQPKGYPLEHMVGDLCPDGITSVAEGVTRTLEGMAETYKPFAENGEVPESPDRGVDENVFKRLDPDQFSEFHEQASADADLARQAYEEEDKQESARLWRQLLGSKFPGPDSDEGDGSGGESKGGYTHRIAASVPPGGHFA